MFYKYFQKVRKKFLKSKTCAFSLYFYFLFQYRTTKRPRYKSKSKGRKGSVRGQMYPATSTQPPEDDFDEETYIREAKQRRHETLSEENVHVGLMFGSKAMIQLLVNPFVGPWTNK